MTKMYDPLFKNWNINVHMNISYNLFILFYVHRYFTYKFVYATHSCSTYKGQKRAADPLELELQIGCEGPYGYWELNSLI